MQNFLSNIQIFFLRKNFCQIFKYRQKYFFDKFKYQRKLFLSRFVGAALLPLDDAVVKEDQAELTVHEAWLAIRESVEPELSR